MDTITEYMSIDHKHCDDVFAALERSVSAGQWDTAHASFKEFAEAMQLHLAMEEAVLFPAFEAASGNSSGPTAVMRSEHQQMRDIIDDLREALEGHDAEGFSGVADTMNILLQQHNMKEEGILYPMTDRVLSARRETLLSEMNNLTMPAQDA